MAARRRVLSEFVGRGKIAIERWKQVGGGHTVDEALADLQRRLIDVKKQAAARRSKSLRSTRSR